MLDIVTVTGSRSITVYRIRFKYDKDYFIEIFYFK